MDEKGGKRSAFRAIRDNYASAVCIAAIDSLVYQYRLGETMRGIRTAIFLSSILFFTPTMFSQDVSLTVSDRAEELAAKIEETGDAEAYQWDLVEEYLANAEPELALLEILEYEQNHDLAPAQRAEKGKILLWLELEKRATNALAEAYFAKPNNETAMYLAVADRLSGGAERSARTLTEIGAEDPDLAMKLAKLYQDLFLSGKKVAAGAAADALRDYDPEAYHQYFPLPQISIYSPEEGYQTDAAEVSVVFDVKHGNPIRRITVADSTIYELSEEDEAHLSERSFNGSFTSLTPVGAGRNDVAVVAEDVFGYSSTATATVNGLNFTRPAEWSAPLADSLKAAVAYVESYVGDEILAIDKDGTYRAVVFSYSDEDSISAFDKGLYWNDLLAHPRVGLPEKRNVKTLIGERATAGNVDMIFGSWILPALNLKTKLFVYLNGSWRIDDDEWSVGTADGRADVKPHIETIARTANGGMTIVFGGLLPGEADRLEAALPEALNASSAGAEAAILADAQFEWKFTRGALDASIATVESLRLDADAIAEIDSRARVVSNGGGSVPFGENPALKARAAHGSLYDEFEAKISSDRLSASEKQTVLEFVSDWRRYSEMKRYVENRLPAEDLLIQAEEYFSRTEEEGQ